MPYHTEYLHRNKIKFTAPERISNSLCSFTYLHILLKILKQGIKYFVAHVLRSWPCYLF